MRSCRGLTFFRSVKKRCMRELCVLEPSAERWLVCCVAKLTALREWIR